MPRKDGPELTTGHHDFRDRAAKPAPRPKVLREIVLTKAKNGGVIATHRHTHMEHDDEPYTFSEGEGEKMADHLQSHGMMPSFDGYEEEPDREGEE